MSESRRLNTDDAPRSVYHAGDAQRTVNVRRSTAGGVLSQQEYEAARRRAQAAAANNSRRTRSFNRVQQHDIDRYQAARQQAGAQPQAQRPAQPAQPAQPAAQQPLTLAQRQAMEIQRRAAANNRTIHRSSGTQVRRLDLNETRGSRPHYDMNDDPEYRARLERRAAQATARPQQPAAAAPAASQPVMASRTSQNGSTAGKAGGSARSGAGASGAGGGKPPRGGNGGKAGKGGKGGKNGKGGSKKKKGSWWKILLGTLAAIVLIFAGTLFFIIRAIAPEAGAIKISQLINTPKELQDSEFNVLITGVDRSSTDDLSAGAANDSNVNDGMTDMILYLHFNNETGEVRMLQIPRDTMVTTDTSVSGNYRINGVAKTQGSDNNNNMAALCELVADQYKLPIDGYITIRLEMLVSLVDTFGGVELNVPQDMDFQGSHLSQGYQTLNGAACEFLLRARKIYPDGDIGRLNMQRQFYSALFRKLKSIGNIWDVAKMVPAVVNYLETDLSVTKLVSFAVSMLKVESSKIMICQMPVYMGGPKYNDQDLLYPARQEDADLLNQYFRENTGPVDASELNLCDNVVALTGGTVTDPNIQYMGDLMQKDSEAQVNDNLDGSHVVDYVEPTPDPADSADSAGSDAAQSDAEPAA